MSPSVNKRNKQVKHGSQFTWLCAFTSLGYVQQELTVLTLFLPVFTRQWYDITNDVTRASLTVEDRLLIKALRIEKGWRWGSNDCGISCQTVETTHVFTHERTYKQPFLVTMSPSTNKHRYKNKLLGLLLPPPWRKTLREISNFIVKILLYLICVVGLMTDT